MIRHWTNKSVFVILALVLGWVFQVGGVGTAHASSLCVNPGGTEGCYATIQAAVDAAAAGDTVTVATGIYKEDVSITKALTLQGAGSWGTTIDATGLSNGIVVNGVTAATTISGFTVENANLEGILLQNSAHVTVSNDRVSGNDLNRTVSGDTSSCAGAMPMEQDDCGEGVHLVGTSFSTIAHNTVTGNAGGILLTDETGPTHDNTINGNMVVGNPYDCGVTLASHVAHPGSTVDPTVGGIYNNMVVNNTSLSNGGAGAGVFAAAPGGAAYNNTIAHNILGGNTMPGASIHSHSPFQNVNGNSIVNNTVFGNGVDGEEGIAGVQPGTTGIDVLSDPGADPISTVTISANRISNETYGIFTANVAQVNGLPSNMIDAGVTTPIYPTS